MVDLLLRAGADETMVDIHSETALDKVPGNWKNPGPFLWTSSLYCTLQVYDVLRVGSLLDRARGDRCFVACIRFVAPVALCLARHGVSQYRGDSRLFFLFFETEVTGI